jgi:hypothetical protein
VNLVRPTTPLGRAVVPVAGGILLIAAIFGATWGVAAWISRGGAESTERLAPSTVSIGSVVNVAEEIDEDGPLLFPDLHTTVGDRTLVLDHTGTDVTEGWRVYWAFPADRDSSCLVEQIKGTDRFTDCDGREIGVDELEVPTTACPIVESRETISVGLRLEVCQQYTTR